MYLTLQVTIVIALLIHSHLNDGSKHKIKWEYLKWRDWVFRGLLPLLHAHNSYYLGQGSCLIGWI